MMMLTDEGRMIGDVAERLLGDMPADDPALAHWGVVAEAGLPLILAAEDHGGFGLPVQDAMAIVRLTGAHATPLPLAETIIANWLLSEADLPIASGVASFGSATVGLGKTATGWHAQGLIDHVPWGRDADVVMLGASDAGSHLVRLALADIVSVEKGQDLAGQPSDSLSIDVAVDDPFVSDAPANADRLLRAGAAMRCVQMAGAIQAVLDMTVTHVREREQFGRALSAFQVVQHQVAMLASEAAAASVAADMAVDAIANGLEWRAIAAAKIRIGEAAGKVASAAHQLHGAIGFTEEHRLHRFVRRLWAWRAAFGGESAWALRLGNDLASGGDVALWPALTEI